MSDNRNQKDPSSQAFQGDLRNAAAGLIKSLIRARALQEPNFLAAEVYDRWGVAVLKSENRTCDFLLTMVAELLAKFKTEFYQNQWSISEPDSGEDEGSIENLFERVAVFIHGDLDEAIRVAAKGKKVAWDQLANWDMLASLRNALDKLPQSLATNAAGVQATAQSRNVILYGPGDAPLVNGKEKSPLTQLRYKLIKRLIEAGKDGCTKSQLVAISADYWKSLKALKDADADWNQVIRFPGKSHGQYRID